MEIYQFFSGKEKSRIQFELSNDGLTMHVAHLDKQYDLKFLDGLLTERYTSDWGVKKNENVFSFYHGDSQVTVNGNTIEFVTVPVRRETGEVLSGVKATNRFTVVENQVSVIQETFFEVDGIFYDCSHIVGRIELNTGDYETVGNDKAGFSFRIEDLDKSNIAYPGELILKGENRYLKINGGFVALCGSIIDSHCHTLNYNDTPSYYSEDNSLYTVYSFEDCENPALPERKQLISEEQVDIFALDSGNLRTELVVKTDGIAFWHKDKEQPVIAMALRKLATGEFVYVDTLSKWGGVSVMQNNDKTEFLLSQPDGIGDISLKLTADIVSDKNRLEWEVDVINNSDDYSLMWCTYPRLYCECNESCNLFMPENGGTEFCGFSDTDIQYNAAYPDGFKGTMAYMALYAAGENKENGMYYAIHDSSGSRKEFQAASSQTGSVRLTCRFYAEGWGEAKNTNHLPGKAVFQSFSGDWFDATDIYGEFVHKECYWAKRDIDDKKTPLWMQDIPFWIMDWVPYDKDSGEILPTNLRTDSDVVKAEDWYENVIRLQEEVGTPIGYHVYNWHKIPFNNDYPHFMPAKENFKNGLKELKKHDIRVMPYINVLLWDTKDRGNEDFEFSKFGKPGSVKNEDGTPLTFSFESRESDGEKVKLAAMCPSDLVWRDKLVKLTSDMFSELDVDAIYLDQLAARIPLLCVDENHNHPKGGGSWWAKEYNEMMKELNRHKPEGKAFTTECNAEVYAANIDGFLSWTWNKSVNDVPAFMRIYSDLIKVFGRNTNGYIKHSDMHWKYNLAQSLVCGQQLGWVNADLVKMPARLSFVRKLAGFRYEYREFFRHANVMRPPVVMAEKSHMFHSDIGMSHEGVLIKPYICAGAMQNGKENMIVLVNIGKEDMTDVIRFNADEYNPGESFAVHGDGSIKILEKGRIECTVAKESYLCIKWDN